MPQVDADAFVIRAGGKGVNVAAIASHLGARVRLVVGLPEDENDDHYLKLLGDLDFTVEGLRVLRSVRHSLVVADRTTGESSIIREVLPEALTVDRDRLVEEICEAVRPRGIVVLSGSLPESLEPGFYGLLTARLQSAGADVFLDCAGPPLAVALRSSPSLVKINRCEARDLLGEGIEDQVGAWRAVETLTEMGARSCIVTGGPAGAVGQLEGREYTVTATPLDDSNGAGAGDAFMAALAFERSCGGSWAEALHAAAAIGAKATMVLGSGVLPSDDSCTREFEVGVWEGR